MAKIPQPATFFWPLVVALLALMAAAQVTSALQETQTFDEATHLAAGYSYLSTGDYRMNVEHPPLGKILPALPLFFLKPLPRLDSAAWHSRDQLLFAADFLYQNRVPADTLLLAGRSVTILFTLALGLALAIWTRRHFGASTALFALLLYAFDPNFIAHGRYVTNDVMLSFFMLLACFAWGAYLSGGRRRDLIWCGLAFGLAMATKFSAPILLPIFAALWAVKWWQQRRPPVPLLKSLLAIGVMAAVIVGAAYWRETVRLTKASTFTPLKSAIQRRTLAGMLMYRVGDFLDLPAYSYLVGLESAARHDVIGHPSYLLGRLSDKGWWYYFPVAFAVKTPTAVLLLLVVCLFLALRRRFSPRKLSFDYVLLAAPAAIYFLASVRSHLNLGLRHILPIYPFLFILLTAVLFRRMRHYARGALAAVICLLIAVQVAESAHIYPHYLAFFNSLAGGPARGPEYLVDSNIDWGQDLKKVRAWWWAHGSPPLCLAYFGRADAEYYHVPLTWLPATWEREQRAKLDCIGAISVTVLHDVYVKPGEFQWLRELRPMGQVGYSIYLYDLRKR